MRKITWLFLLIFSLMLFSCLDNTQKKYEFFYYPQRNVYYDVSGKMYLYSLDGGKTWDSLNIKTNGEPATLGTKEIIYSTIPEVWKDNEAHVKEYNGQVINITAGDSSFSQTDLAAERKIKKAKAAVTNTDRKEKKPGFFKRLFGKKN